MCMWKVLGASGVPRGQGDEKSRWWGGVGWEWRWGKRITLNLSCPGRGSWIPLLTSILLFLLLRVLRLSFLSFLRLSRQRDYILVLPSPPLLLNHITFSFFLSSFIPVFDVKCVFVLFFTLVLIITFFPFTSLFGRLDFPSRLCHVFNYLFYIYLFIYLHILHSAIISLCVSTLLCSGEENTFWNVHVIIMVLFPIIERIQNPVSQNP